DEHAVAVYVERAEVGDRGAVGNGVTVAEDVVPFAVLIAGDVLELAGHESVQGIARDADRADAGHVESVVLVADAEQRVPRGAVPGEETIGPAGNAQVGINGSVLGNSEIGGAGEVA